MPRPDLAALIDHTLLDPSATRARVETLCAEARQHRFKAVCLHGLWIGTAHRLLEGSGVSVCSVVGFPLGASASEAKAFEAAEAVRSGADEIDMVISLGPLKEGLHDIVTSDIAAVVHAARGRIVKVIIETCLLSEEEKLVACRLSAEAGASFVKTSTGFGGGGATVEDVALMRRAVGQALGVKASGGIRTIAQADALIAAGASRLGTSSGVALVTSA